MEKEVCFEVVERKRVIIDLTGYDVDMTDPKSIEKYIDWYITGNIECNARTVDFDYELVNWSRKKGKR